MDSQEPPPPPPLTLPQPPPPLLPSQNPSYFFTPSSVLPSSSLQPSLSLPSLDIDWISLLSGQAGGGFGDTMMINKEKLQSSCDRNEGGDDDKDEKSGKRRLGGRMSKASRPRFAFQTRSADDILDDGYRWRKYGQKAVKNSIHPRSYYRCTHHTCNVKKQVQRLSKDTSIVVTTYEGIHNHPCEKLMETLTPLLKQMQFLSRF